MIEKYKEDVATFLALPKPGDPKPLKDQSLRLSELLMQNLLKVDGVTCDSAYEMARLKRKQTVQFFQERLDSIDAMRDQLNKIVKK